MAHHLRTFVRAGPPRTLTGEPNVSRKAAFWNSVLALLSAGNLVAVWFAARPGEAGHATIHAALALGFGLWAFHRLRPAHRSEPALAAAAAERLERIERSIDAVAIEVERIGEMERFTARILADRAAEPVPAPVARDAIHRE